MPFAHAEVSFHFRASATGGAQPLKQVDGKTVIQVFMLDNSVKQLLVESWSTAQVCSGSLARGRLCLS
jgi:hypothetical protein